MDLMQSINSSYPRMPDIKRIRIDHVSDSDKDLTDFLLNRAPEHLKFLCINASSTAETLINDKLSAHCLSDAASRVTKEIFIRLFEFSAEDLQNFIKASCNAERIVIERCSVHCSASLDFGSSTNYNIKFLSFQSCGSTNFNELTTDWKTDPSCFINIVDAISRSNIRYNLTKLSISDNPTLDKAQVQEMLISKGMEHIKVVEKDHSPSSE